MLANFQKFQQLEGLTFKIGLSISKSHKTFIINMYSGRALLSPRRDTSAFVPRRPIERLPSRKKQSLMHSFEMFCRCLTNLFHGYDLRVPTTSCTT